MARRKTPKEKITTKVRLPLYDSLEEQKAFQTGIATAIAGVSDVIYQFVGHTMVNGKLPDHCSNEQQNYFKKGLAIAFNGTAEVFQGFTDHIIAEGEKLLKEKGWEGLNTEDDLK